MKHVFGTYAMVLSMISSGCLYAEEHQEVNSRYIVIKQSNDSPATVESENYGYKDGKRYYSKQKGIIDEYGNYREISSVDSPQYTSLNFPSDKEEVFRSMESVPFIGIDNDIKNKVEKRSRIPAFWRRHHDSAKKVCKDYLVRLRKNPRLFIEDEFSVPEEVVKGFRELDEKDRISFVEKLRDITERSHGIEYTTPSDDFEYFPSRPMEREHIVREQTEGQEDLAEKYFKLRYEIAKDSQLRNAILAVSSHKDLMGGSGHFEVLSEVKSLNKHQRRVLKKYFRLMQLLQHNPEVMKSIMLPLDFDVKNKSRRMKQRTMPRVRFYSPKDAKFKRIEPCERPEPSKEEIETIPRDIALLESRPVRIVRSYPVGGIISPEKIH